MIEMSNLIIRVMVMMLLVVDMIEMSNLNMRVMLLLLVVDMIDMSNGNMMVMLLVVVDMMEMSNLASIWSDLTQAWLSTASTSSPRVFVLRLAPGWDRWDRVMMMMRMMIMITMPEMTIVIMFNNKPDATTHSIYRNNSNHDFKPDSTT